MKMVSAKSKSRGGGWGLKWHQLTMAHPQQAIAKAVLGIMVTIDRHLSNNNTCGVQLHIKGPWRSSTLGPFTHRHPPQTQNHIRRGHEVVSTGTNCFLTDITPHLGHGGCIYGTY